MTCEYGVGRKEPITVVFWPTAWGSFTYVVEDTRTENQRVYVWNLNVFTCRCSRQNCKDAKGKGPPFFIFSVNPHTTSSTPCLYLEGLTVLPQCATTFYHLLNTAVSFKVLSKCFPLFEIISNTYPKNNQLYSLYLYMHIYSIRTLY